MKHKIIVLLLIIMVLISIGVTSYGANDIVVILDPGHGGDDPGATAGSMYEKDLNWNIAKKVKEILDSTPGITGILSRKENENPSLYKRGLLAKENGADLLVSFHINSNTKANSLSGAETYITANTNSSRFYKSSKKLAEDLLANLREIGVESNNDIPIRKYSNDGELYTDGFLSDYYGIIRNPMYYGIPSVLIEHAYINNEHDRINYLNNDMLNKIAKQDAKAIIDNMELFRINKDDNAVNAALDNIVIDNKTKYVQGEITAIDWINGMQCIPDLKLNLKSTDGTYSKQCFVNQLGGYRFYFDVNISKLDLTKEYILELETLDKVNIPTRHTITLSFKDRTIGEVSGKIAKCEDNKIIFKNYEYEGHVQIDLLNFSLIKTENDLDYITGEIYVEEYINDICYIPFVNPQITLLNEDGNIVSEFYVNHIDGNKYYFDRNITGIDKTKKYNIRVELSENNNISTQKAKNINFGKYENKGNIDNYNFITTEETIRFSKVSYSNVNSEVKNIQYVHTNSNLDYIMGEIVIVEWINGISNVPLTTPKIILETSSGEFVSECYVNQIAGHRYYFDRNITGIDKSKMYRLKLVLSDSNNQSEEKTMYINFLNKQIIGRIGEYKIQASGLIINFINTYIGNINSEVKYINLNTNSQGRNYISGNIVIVEWANYLENNEYISTVPMTLPKMTLKDEDGNYYNMFINQVSGHLYYFDKFIDGLDLSKKYYIELELTGTGNLSENKKMKLYFGSNKNMIEDQNGIKLYTDQEQIIFETDR